MPNLYKSGIYATGQCGYILSEPGDRVPDGFTLVKSNLSQEQVDLLREIGIIPTVETMSLIQKIAKNVAENPPDQSTPVFELIIDKYDSPKKEWSGWTWFLKIGKNNFAGFDRTPGYSGLMAQRSPQDAFESFIKWLGRAGANSIQQTLLDTFTPQSAFLSPLDAKPQIFSLNLVNCDYNRAWTWVLKMGERNFVGWEPRPGMKAQESPWDAFLDFRRWANEVGLAAFKEAIAKEYANSYGISSTSL